MHGDAKATAEALLAGARPARDDRRQSPAGGAATRCASASGAGDNHHFPHPDESSTQFIDPRILSKAVDAILPADRAVASDSGHFCGWVPRYLRVPNARASCLSHSFQSVGLGLPSTIGLAIANPGKLAVLGTGDGGFLMSIADLETAIRLGLRLCILVYNDASYAAEVHYFRRQGFLRPTSCEFPPTPISPPSRAAMAHCAARRCARLPTSSRSKAWVAEGALGKRCVRHRRQDQSEPRSSNWHAGAFSER